MYTTTPLKHPNTLSKGTKHIFLHKKNKAHSISKLLEAFGFPEEQPENANLKV